MMFYPRSRNKWRKETLVNQALDYARKVWTEMGFKEMNGEIVVSSFWNFDALFTAQDQSRKKMQDTFFINKKMNFFLKKKIVKKIKKVTKGGWGSKGWQYLWNEEKAKKVVLRIYEDLSISAQTSAKVKTSELTRKFSPWKMFSEIKSKTGVMDLNLTKQKDSELIENANSRHLFGLLKQFFGKMGFEKSDSALAIFLTQNQCRNNDFGIKIGKFG